jgi:hypothetical protein
VLGNHEDRREALPAYADTAGTAAAELGIDVLGNAEVTILDTVFLNCSSGPVCVSWATSWRRQARRGHA